METTGWGNHGTTGSYANVHEVCSQDVYFDNLGSTIICYPHVRETHDI
jgi:hypothetical protein